LRSKFNANNFLEIEPEKYPFGAIECPPSFCYEKAENPFGTKL